MTTDYAEPEPASIGPRTLAILACCMLLTMADGFDTQAIGFVGPAIIRAWHLAPSMLGSIFSAGLFGALIGAVSLGRAGDRFGQVRVLTITILLLSAGTFSTVWVESRNLLLIVRFITGIGLGGALPNLLALTAGKVSAHLRSTSVSVVLIGIPLGATVGGIGSATLIAAHGWHSVFVMGGLLPLPVLFILVTLISGERRVVSGERRVFPVTRESEQVDSGAGGASGIRALLAPVYRTGTIVLCTATFFSVMLTYTLISWLPTLLTERGFSMRQAVLATVLLNFGSIFGGLAAGRLSDVRGPYIVIVAAYTIGGIAIALIGTATGMISLLFAIAASALFALGGQTGIGTLSTTFYGASLRATGVGVALGTGRLGAVFGPLLIGMLLARGTHIAKLFYIGGGEALLIAGLIAGMGCATRSDVRPLIPSDLS